MRVDASISAALSNLHWRRYNAGAGTPKSRTKRYALQRDRHIAWHNCDTVTGSKGLYNNKYRNNTQPSTYHPPLQELTYLLQTAHYPTSIQGGPDTCPAPPERRICIGKISEARRCTRTRPMDRYHHYSTGYPHSQAQIPPDSHSIFNPRSHVRNDRSGQAGRGGGGTCAPRHQRGKTGPPVGLSAPASPLPRAVGLSAPRARPGLTTPRPSQVAVVGARADGKALNSRVLPSTRPRMEPGRLTAPPPVSARLCPHAPAAGPDPPLRSSGAGHNPPTSSATPAGSRIQRGHGISYSH